MKLYTAMLISAIFSGAFCAYSAEVVAEAPALKPVKEMTFDKDGNSDDAVRGKAMSFDGTNSVSLGKIVPKNGEITVSCFAKFAAADQQLNRRKVVLGNSASYWKTPFTIFFDGTAYRGMMNAVQLMPNETPNVADRFVSLVWTISGTENRFYVDGKLVKRYNVPKTVYPAEGLELYVGGAPDGGNFVGIVDEVKIFDRALSAEEVESISKK